MTYIILFFKKIENNLHFSKNERSNFINIEAKSGNMHRQTQWLLHVSCSCSTGFFFWNQSPTMAARKASLKPTRSDYYANRPALPVRPPALIHYKYSLMLFLETDKTVRVPSFHSQSMGLLRIVASWVYKATPPPSRIHPGYKGYKSLKLGSEHL